jgi:hypothetical protein
MGGDFQTRVVDVAGRVGEINMQMNGLSERGCAQEEKEYNPQKISSTPSAHARLRKSQRLTDGGAGRQGTLPDLEVEIIE